MADPVKFESITVGQTSVPTVVMQPGQFFEIALPDGRKFNVELLGDYNFMITRESGECVLSEDVTPEDGPVSYPECQHKDYVKDCEHCNEGLYFPGYADGSPYKS